jgi:hypothetical protein
MLEDFSLLLFASDPGLIRPMVAAGVRGIIVDWENLGKEARQSSADTQINRHTLDDLRRARAATDALVICRLNGYGPTTAREIEHAVGAGADEILVPMVRTAKEVETFLDRVRGRCRVGIMLETVDAVTSPERFAHLPLSRVYVGLNDLAIERKSPNIFVAVADGTVERLRRPFGAPFGFGGLTLPDRGCPVPCRLLIAEMARLDCRFGILRRSFLRDMHGRDPSIEVPRILDAVRLARLRRPATVARDRHALETAIGAWRSGAASVEAVAVNA